LAEPAGLDAEIAGTPAYRLAELYLSLSGRTTGSAQSLQQWARQLQPAVQTFGAEKLTAAITWALKDDAQKWWVGRLRDWDALLRNLATVVAQFDAEELKASRGDSIWQNRQGPVDDSPQTAPAPSQALSDSAAAIAARMYEPIAQEPSSRDVARIAELLGKQPQAEVLETLDWAMKNEFWLSRCLRRCFAEVTPRLGDNSSAASSRQPSARVRTTTWPKAKSWRTTRTLSLQGRFYDKGYSHGKPFGASVSGTAAGDR
jgi:hypothetical protein